MNIKERILHLIEKSATVRNVSHLETELNLGKATIYKWGERQPSIDSLILVANYFNVSTDYLLGLTLIERPIVSRLSDRTTIQCLACFEVNTTSYICNIRDDHSEDVFLKCPNPSCDNWEEGSLPFQSFKEL